MAKSPTFLKSRAFCLRWVLNPIKNNIFCISPYKRLRLRSKRDIICSRISKVKVFFNENTFLFMKFYKKAFSTERQQKKGERYEFNKKTV